ncbi:cytochrome c oxidase assembly protein COX20, mitochondrial-like [Amphibalanus amphitrite]|uniref:cytochrome c oxidase assembly protein COX20, mitochondrial-like n=1 Tax=Amphibalanus amphitrite TaxID=1232801 RepID=UPI001C9202F4|nr:cytochrome c oxidase assembly protein COX20, mitochondrial-like [Amphibalanus amphitrite]XP_043227552.1 cytochrome c oxidase assembly protein COX20, mitochondrial-like [Amphibalanus amphitrite]XP_043227553.1 cytochrome c oxidase assembly protein COX20, mitochondrial-like [Amphibalanus amphitrite]XP_043227554.1 cytochrome c oxidase assembly protein COX20, mitochondrial-like [Amphibalanus amphitrite]XP_043227555.1 cytochrome c oxidase assembly protein COX20, mitochondrial-like [Amphibalanus am
MSTDEKPPAEPGNREVSLHGRQLSSIPCFRQTYLTGIGSGLAAGLTTFMMTSRPRTASHVAFGTFFTTTLGYWFYCRYTFARASFHHRQLKHAMKQHILTEGTDEDVVGVPEGGAAPPTRPEIADA